MSIKIKKIKIEDKYSINEINFHNLGDSLTSVVFSDKHSRQTFLNVLKSNVDYLEGEFLLNDFHSFNKNLNKRRLAIIKANTYLSSFIPLKIRLFFSLLINPEFNREALTGSIDSRFEYNNFVVSKGNLEEINLRKKIENLVQKFVDNAIDVEKND